MLHVNIISLQFLLKNHKNTLGFTLIIQRPVINKFKFALGGNILNIALHAV